MYLRFPILENSKKKKAFSGGLFKMDMDLFMQIMGGESRYDGE